jgi:UDP-N-acetylglucosamine--N-acetylmuramyl-(pentapeptide) pyrophosphoryl-undecaprenol N-acetylglucosamine transferase
MRVLVVSGASGGHIFPALAFLDALKGANKDAEALLVLPRNNIGEGREIPFNNVRYISASTIRLNLHPESLFSILKLFKAALESLFILLQFKPDVVIGFGSLSSVPMILLAWLLRIKTLIHEQNVIPGRANRFLAKFCDKIAISFEKTKQYFKDYEYKTVLTGNPLRKDLIRHNRFKALDFFGFKANRFTLLVMGGSQASHSINLGFLKALSGLSGRSGLQVIHLCGAEDFGLLDSAYKDLKINFKLVAFLKEMQYAYSAASLAVCRAGATTIQELIYFDLPAILIPYPFAREHQMANALLLQEKGCVAIIEDAELETPKLRNLLEDFIGTPAGLEVMRTGYDSLRGLTKEHLLVQAAVK